MITPHFRSLEAFPPFLIRILARSEGGVSKMLPTGILARKAALPVDYVKWMGRQTSWSEIPCWRADRFLAACGVGRLTDLRRKLNQELRHQTPFKYLSHQSRAALLLHLGRLDKSHPFFDRK